MLLGRNQLSSIPAPCNPGCPQPVPPATVLPPCRPAGLPAAASQATPSWVLLISFFYKSHSLIMVNNESIFPDLCPFYPNCILTSMCIFDPSHDGKKTLSYSDRIKRKSVLRMYPDEGFPVGSLLICWLLSLFSIPVLWWTLTASRAVVLKRSTEGASCHCRLIATWENS